MTSADGWHVIIDPKYGQLVVNAKGERECADCGGPTGDSGLRSGQCWPCKEKHGILCWVCMGHCGLSPAYCAGRSPEADGSAGE